MTAYIRYVITILLSIAATLQGQMTAGKFIAGDATDNDEFGISAAMTAAHVIVGAHRDRPSGSYSGSAYIFERSGDLLINEVKLVANDVSSYSRFGWSVDIDGDYAIVGAKGDEHSGPNTGAAYIFQKSGTSWTEQIKLIETGGAERDDEFGVAVDIDGDVVAIGAHGDDDNRGSVYIYRRSGSDWDLEATLTASDGGSDDFFGGALALQGQILAVGAAADGDGSVYLFADAGGNWTETGKITPFGGNSGEAFGCALAMDGNVLVVGACEADDPGENAGAAYIFQRSGGSWLQEVRLLPGDLAADDEFGSSIAVLGTTVLVGAYRHDAPGSNTGAVYLFANNGGWSQTQKLTADDGEAEDRFGRAVAIHGNYLAVGAYRDDEDGEEDCGSVYLYNRSGTVGVEDHGQATPGTFRLEQNYPNPFNPGTIIPYQLTVVSEVDLAVYNILGQRIRTLAAGRRSAGRYQIRWDGRDGAGRPVASGIYMYQLRSESAVQTRRMLLMR